MRELAAPTPHPRAAIPGSGAQGQGMWENRGGPAMVFREAGPLRPFHRRPESLPARVPFPASSPLPWSFPQPALKVILLRSPSRLGCSPGVPPPGPGHPRSRAPAHWERLSCRGWVGRRPPPSTPARSIPGHCCHRRPSPTLPPTLPAWRGLRAAALRPDGAQRIPLPRMSISRPRQRGGQGSPPTHTSQLGF